MTFNKEMNRDSPPRVLRRPSQTVRTPSPNPKNIRLRPSAGQDAPPHSAPFPFIVSCVSFIFIVSSAYVNHHCCPLQPCTNWGKNVIIASFRLATRALSFPKTAGPPLLKIQFSKPCGQPTRYGPFLFSSLLSSPIHVLSINYMGSHPHAGLLGKSVLCGNFCGGKQAFSPPYFELGSLYCGKMQQHCQVSQC